MTGHGFSSNDTLKGEITNGDFEKLYEPAAVC